MRFTTIVLLVLAPSALALKVFERAAATSADIANGATALTDQLGNATAAIGAGRCTTTCGPWTQSLEACVTSGGANSTAIGVCACQPATTSTMSTCGSCLGSVQDFNTFNQLCNSLVATTTPNATTTAAAASSTPSATVPGSTSAASTTSAAVAAATTTARSGANSLAASKVVGAIAIIGGALSLLA